MNTLMEEITGLLDERLTGITISNPRKSEEIKKYNIRPVLMKDKLIFQAAGYTKTQVFHENLEGEAMEAWLRRVLPLYKQVQLRHASLELNAMLNKKGVANIKKKRHAVAITPPDPAKLLHNREKRYILKEGTDVPFLRELGVMTAEGKIVRTRYDKFRQINRFLEFIEDVLPYLPKDREVTILDFGCGKSYLTFAMYYYLKILKDYQVRIIGLDLKKDVIRKCSRLAQEYGYDRLSFKVGSIEDYDDVDQVDMVVTLHACDTATDYAMEKAVRWGARVILSVPCCQHEVNGQIHNDAMKTITDFGILKERFSALATDGIRARLLEAVGFETQILEFIDMEHTPKNLLVRAIRKNLPKQGDGSGHLLVNEEKFREVKAFCDMLQIKPTLLTLLEEAAGRGKEDPA